MKNRSSLSLIKPFFCIFFVSSFCPASAQVPFEVIDRYDEWFTSICDSARGKSNNQYGVRELTTLVSIAISDERVELIVPLLLVGDADSIVIFGYSSQIRRYFKGHQVEFISNNFPDDVGFQRIPLSKIRPAKVNFDSVYRYMHSNPLINSNKFSLDDLDRKEG